ncbi:hypothetical protein BN2537_17335 [Streptomyces venezuelae]|nr:hypothetical protein BN2537_17335 [Streptomyces venezuelae]
MATMPSWQRIVTLRIKVQTRAVEAVGVLPPGSPERAMGS